MSGSPLRVHYPSKRDGWLLALLAVPLLIELAVGVAVALAPVAFAQKVLTIAMVLAITGFIVWITMSTAYTLDDTTLAVRSGPFSWTIPLAQIQSVTPTNNPLSSPALSLDRLAIAYEGRTIMISPDDKRAFLEAVAARSGGLRLDGDRLVRTS